VKCVVTGSSGYIGSFLVPRLLKEGHCVVGFDCKSPLEPVDGVEYVMGDISSKEDLSEVFGDADVVFHCAAFVKDFGPKAKFFEINLEGTKNVADACGSSLSRFVFLGHIPYEKKKANNLYRATKDLALDWLLEKHKLEDFPLVVLRPGNVFGPGQAMWVMRPLLSLKRGRLTLVDGGRGVFHHTYVENLVDALLLAGFLPGIDGGVFNITDGDNETTWGKYFNDLAHLLDESVKLSLPKSVALALGHLFLFFNRLSGRDPIVTPMAVEIFSNREKVSIDEANKVLGYCPHVSYDEAMQIISSYLREMKLI